MGCAAWPILQCGWVGLAVIAFSVVIFVVLAVIGQQATNKENQ